MPIHHDFKSKLYTAIESYEKNDLKDRNSKSKLQRIEDIRNLKNIIDTSDFNLQCKRNLENYLANIKYVDNKQYFMSFIMHTSKLYLKVKEVLDSKEFTDERLLRLESEANLSFAVQDKQDKQDKKYKTDSTVALPKVETAPSELSTLANNNFVNVDINPDINSDSDESKSNTPKNLLWPHFLYIGISSSGLYRKEQPKLDNNPAKKRFYDI